MTNQSTTTTTITSTDSSVNQDLLSVNQDLIDSIKDPIAKNIETISSLHIQESRNVTNHQQMLESVALFFGQPIFLYLLLILFAIWIGDNFLASLVPFDLPKFRWTDDGLGAASLIISTGVLIRQTRQEKLAEQRSQLTLHLDLLVEQKTAKIIALLEELRSRRLPVERALFAGGSRRENQKVTKNLVPLSMPFLGIEHPGKDVGVLVLVERNYVQHLITDSLTLAELNQLRIGHHHFYAHS